MHGRGWLTLVLVLFLGRLFLAWLVCLWEVLRKTPRPQDLQKKCKPVKRFFSLSQMRTRSEFHCGPRNEKQTRTLTDAEDCCEDVCIVLICLMARLPQGSFTRDATAPKSYLCKPEPTRIFPEIHFSCRIPKKKKTLVAPPNWPAAYFSSISGGSTATIAGLYAHPLSRQAALNNHGVALLLVVVLLH